MFPEQPRPNVIFGHNGDTLTFPYYVYIILQKLATHLDTLTSHEFGQVDVLPLYKQFTKLYAMGHLKHFHGHTPLVDFCKN